MKKKKRKMNNHIFAKVFSKSRFSSTKLSSNALSSNVNLFNEVDLCLSADNLRICFLNMFITPEINNYNAA